jgi:hypothetical protein
MFGQKPKSKAQNIYLGVFVAYKPNPKAKYKLNQATRLRQNN